MLFADLAMLKIVPEPILAEISIPRLLKYMGTARSVQYEAFTKTPAEKQAEQQAQLQANGQLVGQQATADLAVAAGKEAVKAE
jgi:hypothetical protein